MSSMSSRSMVGSLRSTSRSGVEEGKIKNGSVKPAVEAATCVRVHTAMIYWFLYEHVSRTNDWSCLDGTELEDEEKGHEAEYCLHFLSAGGQLAAWRVWREIYIFACLLLALCCWLFAAAGCLLLF